MGRNVAFGGRAGEDMPCLIVCRECGGDVFQLYVGEGGDVEWVMCAKEFGGCGRIFDGEELDKLKGTFDVTILKRLTFNPADLVGG